MIFTGQLCIVRSTKSQRGVRGDIGETGVISGMRKLRDGRALGRGEGCVTLAVGIGPLALLRE